MLARPVYKCPLCGQLTQVGNETDLSTELFLLMTEKVISDQRFAGNPALCKAPLYGTHKCPDGSVGLAQFAGFQRIEP